MVKPKDGTNLTVGELKEALKNAPDKMRVILYCLDIADEQPIHSVGIETGEDEQPTFCINYY